MKKLLLIIFFLLPIASFASIDYDLQYGMQNPKVSEFQKLLGSEKCLFVSPTGYFGNLTLLATKCFQAKYKILQTGYVGPLTRAQANKLAGTNIAVATATPVPTPVATVRPSNSSNCVMAYYGVYNGVPQYYPQCSTAPTPKPAVTPVVKVQTIVQPQAQVQNPTPTPIGEPNLPFDGATLTIFPIGGLNVFSIKNYTSYDFVFGQDALDYDVASSDFTSQELDSISVAMEANNSIAGDGPLTYKVPGDYQRVFSMFVTGSFSHEGTLTLTVNGIKNLDSHNGYLSKGFPVTYTLHVRNDNGRYKIVF